MHYRWHFYHTNCKRWVAPIVLSHLSLYFINILDENKINNNIYCKGRVPRVSFVSLFSMVGIDKKKLHIFSRCILLLSFHYSLIPYTILYAIEQYFDFCSRLQNLKKIYYYSIYNIVLSQWCIIRHVTLAF